MITISEFFELNNQLILFVYGLAFFILGFAIILQTRQTSRLELAYNLRWLAAFGIAHGFYEWSDLFIPIQEVYLSKSTVEILHDLRLILLAVSFTCLLEFGLMLLFPIPRKRFIHWQTLTVFVFWFLITFFILPGYYPELLTRFRVGNALSRYFIQLPGGLLAAYGLHAHTRLRVAPLNAPQITRTFQSASFLLLLYTLFGGPLPPPVPFFPGDTVNTQTFTTLTGIPPMIFRSLLGFAITLTLVRGLEIFDLETERRIEHLEQQQIINAERERLARDLHDGAIQKVYTAGLLVESAARLAEPETELDKRLKRAVAVISDAIQDLRRNLAELHASAQIQQTSLSDLLRAIPQNPNYNTMVNISVKTELPEGKVISARRANHIIAIINEALANVVRHANAQNVSIAAINSNDLLHIEIKDDGLGLPEQFINGYGLRNMNDRTRLLNGKIEFKNNHGLLIRLDIPWED